MGPGVGLRLAEFQRDVTPFSGVTAVVGLGVLLLNIAALALLQAGFRGPTPGVDGQRSGLQGHSLFNSRVL